MSSEILIDPAEQSAARSGSGQYLSMTTIPLGQVFAIPRRQLYYWTDEWQAGERETLRAYNAGDSIRFLSGHDFAAWLLQSDDGDEDDTSDGD